MIEQTDDTDFIERCITHPKVWMASKDDGAGDPELFFLELDGKAIWLRAGDDGVFMLHPHNSVMWECHTMLLPSAYGRAVELGKEALQWAWDNTGIMRVITNVPAFNPLALRMAKRVGFEQYAVNPNSFLKDGVLHDQFVLGINRR